jgi:predicted RNA-binding Zn ribbon-like protein
METQSQELVRDMALVGGSPALDFVNTLAGGVRGQVVLPRDERLFDYSDLLDLGRRSGTLSESDAKRLAREARGRPVDAAAAVEEAYGLRKRIDAVYRPLSEGRRPVKEALAELRRAGAQALEHADLEPTGTGFRWVWHPRNGDLEAPLWPLAHDAVDLLTREELGLLRGCGRCRWLFLDLSRNHSRRWCTMEGCGTDEKKGRYVARRRARRAGAGG